MKSTGSDYGRLDKPPAILCDFDDTVTVQNVAELLLRRFSDGRWEDLRRQTRERLITFREYQELAFRNIGASREEMSAYVCEQAVLRPGLRELWQYSRATSIPLAVATLGLDFYVGAVLEREGLSEVPTYAVKTTFTSQGIEYNYPYARKDCTRWGTCKCSVLESYRGRGYSIIFVGDGVSDFCPASRADLVFARSHLASQCHEAGIPYLEFEGFQNILDHLQRTAGGEVPG